MPYYIKCYSSHSQVLQDKTFLIKGPLSTSLQFSACRKKRYLLIVWLVKNKVLDTFNKKYSELKNLSWQNVLNIHRFIKSHALQQSGATEINGPL